MSVTDGQISITNLSFPNRLSTAAPDCRVVVRVRSDPTEVPGSPGSLPANVTNSVAANETSATGPGCAPCQSDPFNATIVIEPEIAATVTKSFNPSTIPLGGNTTLRITIRNNAPYPLNNVSLTDTMPAAVASLLVAGTGTANTNCGVGATVTATGDPGVVSLTGASIPPNSTCRVEIVVTGQAVGSYTNDIPANTLISAEGATNATPTSAVLSVQDSLSLQKTHNGAESISVPVGGIYYTELRFSNLGGQLTNFAVTDLLPNGVTIANSANYSTTPVGCAGTFASAPDSGDPSRTRVTISGATVPGANLGTGQPGVCTFRFRTVVTAAFSSQSNTVNPSDVTNTQNKQPIAPDSAQIVGTPTPGAGASGALSVYKDWFGPSGFSVAPNGSGDRELNGVFWMRLGAFNNLYDRVYTNGSMTDVLPLGVQVDVAGGAGTIALTDNADIKYLANHNNPSQGPNSTTANSFPGCSNTGTVTVVRAANGQDTVTYNAWSIREASVSADTEWFNTGCWFSIRLKGITPGNYRNEIPATNITTTQGATNPNPARVDVRILSLVGIEKAFNSFVVNPGGLSRLTVWIVNKSSAPITNASVSDTLPTAPFAVTVAATPNVETDCGVAALVTATPGAGVVSIAGADVPTGTQANPSRCFFALDVLVPLNAAASASATNTIPENALTTGQGLTNAQPATASLLTRPRTISLNKTFGNGGAATGGQPVPLTIEVRPDQWPLTSVSFSDTLPAGVLIAPNPNPTTTCRTIGPPSPVYIHNNGETRVPYPSNTPATIMATPGGNTITVSDVYLVGDDFDTQMGTYLACTVTVDVVATTTGNKTNTIPANNATSDQGATNTTPTSATLTVQPNTNVQKAFSPSTVSIGQPFTLTISVLNVNTSAQNNFTITDTLPSGITASAIVSNSCGGNAAITGGGAAVELSGATVVGANATCAVVVTVVAAAGASYTNDQSNLTASVGIDTQTTTTVVAVPPPTVTKAFAPTSIAIGETSVLTITIGAATTARTNVSLTDNLPAIIHVANPANASNTCGGTFNPASGDTTIALTGGTLAAGASCTLSVTVTNNGIPTPPFTRTNTIPAGGLMTGEGDSTSPATADITVNAFSLGNRVWFDADNDGTVNGAEVGIDGVVVELLTETSPGVFAPSGTTLTTAAGGYYRFDGLAPGDYRVRVNPSNFAVAGPLRGYFTSGTPNADAEGAAGAGVNNDNNGIKPAGGDYASLGVASGTVTLAVSGEPTNDETEVNGTASYNAVNSGQAPAPNGQSNLTVDFGFHRVSIGNRIWLDTGTGAGETNNGVLDAGEQGVPDGTVVNLVDASGAVIATTTTTGGNGTYVFTTDTAGNALLQSGAPGDVARQFRVVLPTPPSGAVSSSPNFPVAGGNDSRDHGSPGTGGAIESPLFTLTPGASTADQTVTNATATTDQPQLDMGIVPLYSLGNRVWLDTDSSGTINNAEQGKDGVIVNLLNSSGQPLYRQADGSVGTTVTANPITTTTANGGYYRFDALPPGDYVVQIAPVNFQAGGMLFSATTNAPLPTSPTDVGGVDGVDNNSNGLTNANPATNGVLSGAVTLGNGNGNQEPLNEADLSPTGQGSSDARADMTVDFGFVPVTFALGNVVFIDTNNNGIKDGGEVGIGSGVTVSLFADANNDGVPDGAAIASTSTNAGGQYLFSGLSEGLYLVEISAAPLVGYVSSTGINGGASGPYEPGSTNFTATGNDRDHGRTVSPGVIRSRTVTLGLGMPTGEGSDLTVTDPNGTVDARTNLTVDLGVFLPASLGTVVWIDDGAGGGVAGDGIKHAGELGIPGVLVALLDGAGNPVDGDPATPGVQMVTTTTGPNGQYSFTNLIPGTYQVQFNFPPGSRIVITPNPPGSGTPPTNGTPGGLDNQYNEMIPATRRSPVVVLTPGQDNPNLDAGVLSFTSAPTHIPTLNAWLTRLLAMALLALGLVAQRVNRVKR